MGAAKKIVILTLSSAAGTVIGYPIFLFAGLGLLAIYGDDRPPTEFLQHFLFYGIFGITTLIGFAVGLFILKKNT